MSTIKTTVSAAALLAASAVGALADPVLEPTTQKFIDGLAGGKPIYTLSPADARNVLAGAQKGDVKRLAAKEEDRVSKAGPTGSIKLRMVRPEHAKGTLPVILYFHGGGWVLGDADTHDRLVREIANGADAAVVFVDYERSPEARYPVPSSRPMLRPNMSPNMPRSSRSMPQGSLSQAIVSAATWRRW